MRSTSGMNALQTRKTSGLHASSSFDVTCCAVAVVAAIESKSTTRSECLSRLASMSPALVVQRQLTLLRFAALLGRSGKFFCMNNLSSLVMPGKARQGWRAIGMWRYSTTIA